MKRAISRTIAVAMLATAMAILPQPLPAEVDSKIIDRSEKKTPSWVGSQPNGYVEVDVQAPTLSEAKDMAVTEISRRIVESVATNVVATSSQITEIER